MRVFMFVLVLVPGFILSQTSSVPAVTWYITPEGTGDAPTIQAGVDSAAAGDTILVACGTYYEHDIEVTSGRKLISETGEPDCVTIDAQEQGRVLYTQGTSDSTTLIKGFTIMNPSPGGVGGCHSMLQAPYLSIRSSRSTEKVVQSVAPAELHT